MAAQRNVLELQNVKRAFGSKVVLSGVNLAVGFGELVALYGPSGSGKSTLLNLVGAIDRPSEGTIHLAGREVSRMWEMNRTKLRRTQIGFIFQNYPLIAAYSAAENIDMSLRLKGIGLWERRRRIKTSLEAVGLSDHARRLPDQLSGGQQQRVAIARVLALHPTIILADEPTSGLDTRTGRRVMKIFQGLAEAEGTAFLVVSHDIDLTERFVNRAYDLREGQLALRPPIGTVVENHDALEARRRDVDAHDSARDKDDSDDWDADEPDFLADVPREDAPIRLYEPEFLADLDRVPDALPVPIEIAIQTQESGPDGDVMQEAVAPELDSLAVPIEGVIEAPIENVEHDIDISAHGVQEIQDTVMPESAILAAPVEDVVQDADITGNVPDDEADNARS